MEKVNVDNVDNCGIFKVEKSTWKLDNGQNAHRVVIDSPHWVSAGDFAPISKLTTEEVIAIGDYLELPKELVHKTPSDGMCGSSDEDKLGFTYHEVNEFIRTGAKGEHFDKIKKLHDQQIYKIRIIQIPYFDPELPNYFKKINFGL